MTDRRIAAKGFAALLLAALMLQGCAGSADRMEQTQADSSQTRVESSSDARHDSEPAERGRARAISPEATSVVFSNLDGIHGQVASHRGHPVLVNFWATWCVPCVEELPDLARLADEFAEDGPAFVGISLDAWVTGGGDETEKMVRDTLATAGVTYANLIYEGDQDSILSAFDLPGPIPYSILFDRDGRSAATWDAAVDIERFRRAVANLP